ncbi:MAG: hypothetical protein MJZ52_06970, partial [Bacteroidales bacterium]|nr:hypothetical protein [Bacteroidales bacterium]
PLDYTTKEGNYHHLLNLHTFAPSHAAVGHHAFTARAAPRLYISGKPFFGYFLWVIKKVTEKIFS